MISIIISVLNGGDNLKKWLDSIINQNYINKEILIIDGGSIDNTLNIIEDYSIYIHYKISEKDRGIYHAWNKALKFVNGDWICFIGSDDFFINNYSLSLISSLAIFPNVNFVSARVNITNSNGEFLYTSGKAFNLNDIQGGMRIAHPGSLHHISLFKKYGYFNENYLIAGDFEFLIRVRKSLNSDFLDIPIISMKMGGVSNKNKLKAYNETFKVLYNCKDFRKITSFIYLFITLLKTMINEVIKVFKI